MSMLPRKRRKVEKHPYLCGNFAPIERTRTSTPCTYTGTIPDELLGGQYVRNGGNPVSNADLGRDAHWFDGDGMLSGVTFERSREDKTKARPCFVNQYILTDLCLSSLENPSLRTPILPSIATLVNPISTTLSIILAILRTIFLVILSNLPGSRTTIKRISVANTGIHWHDGRALATCESGPPIRIQLPGLETVGWYDGNKAEGEPTLPSNENEPVLGGTGLLSFMKEWATGHPKVDSETGEMVLFHCNFIAPYVHYSVIPATHQQSRTPSLPKLLNEPVPGVSGAKMMHDFGVSKRHTIIMDLPLTLNPFKLLKGQSIVSYDPCDVSRFGIFPRREPQKVSWFQTAASCIFHTANCWDILDQGRNAVAVDLLVCRLTSASLVYSAGNLPVPPRKGPKSSRPVAVKTPPTDPEKLPLIIDPSSPEYDLAEEEQCRLYYYRFNLSTAISAPSITAQYALSAVPFEFPTLNPAFEMSDARYLYGCSTSSASFGAALGRATKIDVLVKVDVHTLLRRGEDQPPKSVTGCVDTRSVLEVMESEDAHDPIKCFRMPKGWYAQEARFVPRSDSVSEDDGYLLFYAFDESQLDREGECHPDAVSELWILEARDFETVVAKVRLPQRVPYGLHGNWFSENRIKGQREVERVRTVPVLDKEDQKRG